MKSRLSVVGCQLSMSFFLVALVPVYGAPPLQPTTDNRQPAGVVATFHPAKPTVGDLITIDFRTPVVLDASPEYEIVSRRGTRVVVRTFKPEPFALSGRAGNVVFRNLKVPVRSVLKPKDTMEPAPLKPPHVPPAPRLPLIAIAIAAAAAIAAWAAVVILARRRARPVLVIPEVAPADRFRTTVQALRDDPRHPQRWAALADATRLFLSSLSPHLGTELTTAEILPRLDRDHVAAVAEVLRQGDLEKFSPWGALPHSFDAAAASVLNIIPVEAAEEAA